VYSRYGEDESGVSWNWQSPKPYSGYTPTPRPYFPPSYSPSAPELETSLTNPDLPSPHPSPHPSPGLPRGKEGWERRGSDGSCITRTTRYSPSSGFITEVSTTNSPPSSPSSSSPPRTRSSKYYHNPAQSRLENSRSNSSPSSSSSSSCDCIQVISSSPVDKLEEKNNFNYSYTTLPRLVKVMIGVFSLL